MSSEQRSSGLALVEVALGVAVAAGLEIAQHGRISLSQPGVLHLAAPLLLSRLLRSEQARRVGLILWLILAAVVAVLSFRN